MIDLLLNRIKELETKLEKITTNNEEAKEQILTLFKKCKVDKETKDNFKKQLLSAINKLETEKSDKFFNDNFLKFNSFLEIAKNINDGYLVIINADYPDEIKKFIISFLIKKVSPFFTLDKKAVIGIVNDKQFKELKSIDSIPFFNPQTQDFMEIELKKMIFDSDTFDFNAINKAQKIFKEFQKRPAYKNKHYIEYSLIKDKIIDFEREKLDKQKEKYAYIYDETYPNLEFKLKREIKNIPLVLALLERIDKEIDKIKDSKGTINVVNRMLNFIELNIEELRDEVGVLREKIKQ